MDADVALADLASGMTSEIGAEYGGGIHDSPPGFLVCYWLTGVCRDPRFLRKRTFSPRLSVELPVASARRISRRSRISLAALRVKVTARICSGNAPALMRER